MVAVCSQEEQQFYQKEGKSSGTEIAGIRNLETVSDAYSLFRPVVLV